LTYSSVAHRMIESAYVTREQGLFCSSLRLLSFHGYACTLGMAATNLPFQTPSLLHSHQLQYLHYANSQVGSEKSNGESNQMSKGKKSRVCRRLDGMACTCAAFIRRFCYDAELRCGEIGIRMLMHMNASLYKHPANPTSHRQERDVETPLYLSRPDPNTTPIEKNVYSSTSAPRIKL